MICHLSPILGMAWWQLPLYHIPLSVVIVYFPLERPFYELYQNFLFSQKYRYRQANLNTLINTHKCEHFSSRPLNCAYMIFFFFKRNIYTYIKTLIPGFQFRHSPLMLPQANHLNFHRLRCLVSEKSLTRIKWDARNNSLMVHMKDIINTKLSHPFQNCNLFYFFSSLTTECIYRKVAFLSRKKEKLPFYYFQTLSMRLVCSFVSIFLLISFKGFWRVS